MVDVAVIMGSKSDQKIADKVTSVLDEYKVKYDGNLVELRKDIVSFANSFVFEFHK